MIIKSFRLASAEDERNFRISGGFTCGMPRKNLGVLPFGIFPDIGLRQIDFGLVSVFSGSAVSIRSLLFKVIASKLAVRGLPDGMDGRCLDGYLDFCNVVYEDFARRNEYGTAYISKQDAAQFIKNKYSSFKKENSWSMLDFYAERIKPDCFVMIEEPESFLSLEELEELATHMYMSAKSGQCQFLISSNSPVMCGIRKAINYDFDSQIYKINSRKGYIQ